MASAMTGTGALYTPQVLGLATSLAQFPLTDDLDLRGQARAASCGSSLTLGLRLGLGLDAGARIARVGLAAQACAIGQASAAIFAAGAVGRTAADIAAAEAQISAWLEGTAPMPDWPGLEAIAAARAFPGRHGAILLGWRAALQALSFDPSGR